MWENELLNKLKRNKNLILIIAILFLGLLSFMMFRYYRQDFGIEKISAEPEEDISVDYFLFAGEELQGREDVPLLVHPFHAGVEEGKEQKETAEKAYQTARSLHTLAREIEGIMVVPAFSLAEIEEQSPDSRQLIERYKESGEELQAIIGHVKEKMQDRDIKIKDRVNLFGFGYSAIYASRWQLLYPEAVNTTILGAPGEWPAVPAEKFKDLDLEFPLGIDDLAMTNNQIGAEAFSHIAIFYFEGEEDEFSLLNDPRIFSREHRQQLENLVEREKEYIEVVNQLYEHYTLDYEYKTYEDVDHRFNLEMHDDVVDFLRKYN